MKKFRVIIMALIAVLLSNTAIAVELDQTVATGGMTVSLNMDPDGSDTKADTYTVVIPTAIRLNPEGGGTSFNIILKAGWELNTAHKLYVRLVDAQNGIKSNSDYNFTLKNTEGDEISYDFMWDDGSITADSSKYNYYKSLNLLEVSRYSDNMQDKKSCWLCCIAKDLPTSGVYTDELTFGIFTE